MSGCALDVSEKTQNALDMVNNTGVQKNKKSSQRNRFREMTCFTVYINLKFLEFLLLICSFFPNKPLILVNKTRIFVLLQDFSHDILLLHITLSTHYIIIMIWLFSCLYLYILYNVFYLVHFLRIIYEPQSKLCQILKRLDKLWFLNTQCVKTKFHHVFVDVWKCLPC